MKVKENKFLHILWGSLNEDHEERTSYIFGEIGYNKQIEKSPYYIDLSFGIGRVSQKNDCLSTENIFTERISISYKDYNISIRHMSNGGKLLGNDGRNLGRTNLTFGVKF